MYMFNSVLIALMRIHGGRAYIYAQISGDTQCRESRFIEQRVNISLMNVKTGY
jgi:hypothetical protein